MEGRSLVPAFGGGAIHRNDALYWEHEGNRAVRDGKWKLVSRYPGKWELYDIEADRSELNDLAAREPDTAARLAGLHDKWAARVGAKDWPTIEKSQMPTGAQDD